MHRKTVCHRLFGKDRLAMWVRDKALTSGLSTCRVAAYLMAALGENLLVTERQTNLQSKSLISMSD